MPGLFPLRKDFLRRNSTRRTEMEGEIVEKYHCKILYSG